MLLRNCKFNTNLLKWTNSKTLAPSSENVEQDELPFTAGGNAQWYNNFGRQFAVSSKTKHSLTINSSKSM
jgi:hypothetical protein